MSLDPRTPIGDVQRLAHELSRINDRLRRLESPTGTQTFRSVDLLEETRNYAETSGAASLSAAGNQNYSDPPEVTFTISRPMVVQVSAVMPYEALISGTGVTSGVAAIWEIGPSETLVVNEYTVIGADYALKRAAYNATTVELDAGTYTIENTEARVFMTAATPGLDTIVGDPITLSVAVLGVA